MIGTRPLRGGPIIILGMHRSGTSCLAGSLESAGLVLGDVVNASPHNKKGNKESKVLRKINDDLLALNGGSWDDPPKSLNWNDELRMRRDAYIADFDGVADWGFKDPRCLLTLPFWREALPDARLVATLRHPSSVVKSLSNRKGMAPKLDSLHLWSAYNHRLLRLCETEDIPLISFDWNEKRYREAVRAIAERLGLHLAKDPLPFFEPDLRSATPDWRTPPNGATAEAEALYQKLLSHAVIGPTGGPEVSENPAASNTQQPDKPKLSIVVIFHEMQREARRTLYGLSEQYQTKVTRNDYEVIAVENGTQRLDPNWVRSHGLNFQYHFHETKSVSPAAAVNFGAACARAPYIALIVDGARIPSPGLIQMTLAAINAFHPCYVSALAWQLGPDIQRKSVLNGYSQAVEDELLASIGWRNQGYNLFDVSTIAPSSECGFLNGLPSECSWLALPLTSFKSLAGYDEGFQSPGGGLVNHDFLKRLTAIPDLTPVQLLGEGSFHQVHGGAMTGSSDGSATFKSFQEEYLRLRGQKFSPRYVSDAVYLGCMPKVARKFVF